MKQKTLLMVFTLATILSFAWSAPLAIADKQAVAIPTSTSELWLNVTSPNGGEVLTSGKNYRITWRSSSKIDKVTIGYKSCPVCKMKWIAVRTSNTGYYNWKVSITDPKVTRIKIHVVGYQTGARPVRDSSDGYSRVVMPPTFTPTKTIIPTFTNTRTPTRTGSPARTQTPSSTFSPTPTDTDLITPGPLVTPTFPTSTSSPTTIYTPIRTATFTRTFTPTLTVINTWTPVPSCNLIYIDDIHFNSDDIEAQVTNNSTTTAYIIASTLTWSPSPLTGGKYFDYIQFGSTIYNPAANIIDSPLNTVHNYLDFPIAGNGTQITWIADFSDDIFIGDWSIHLTFNIPGSGNCIIIGNITKYTGTPVTPSRTPTPTGTDLVTPGTLIIPTIPTSTPRPTTTYTPTRTATNTPNPLTPTRTPTFCADC